MHKKLQRILSRTGEQEKHVNAYVVTLFCVLLQFDKPGARDNYDYPDMAKEAGAYLYSIWTLFCHIWYQ